MISNTKIVGSYIYGAGALNQLPDILEKRGSAESTRVILVDHYFMGRSVISDLSLAKNTLVFYIDTTDEPSTDRIDELHREITDKTETVSIVAGIGGGSTLDIAKAISNLITNGGKAEDYQGWDLVKKPGVYKIGIPTISGTGAETSRTCVMMNKSRNLKLGMNSEYTVFDFLVLDPELSRTVPIEQYFYTGMDTYIHCIESLNGNHRNAFADIYSNKALDLCREVFNSEDIQSNENREKLMIASYLGGCAIGNSFVGVVHPFSAGLSMVFGLHHCISNCIVMNVMDEFYPDETSEFRKFISVNNISLPEGICRDISEENYEKLYESTIVHEKPLINALGDNFRKILTSEKVREVFSRM